MMQIELFQLLTLFDSSICLCTTYTNTLTPSPSSTWQHEESHCDWRQQQWPNFTVLKQLVIASSDVAIDNCPDHVVLRFACFSMFTHSVLSLYMCGKTRWHCGQNMWCGWITTYLVHIWKTVAHTVQMLMLLSLIMRIMMLLSSVMILLSSIRSIIMLLFSMTRTMMLLSSVMTIIANGRFELADWFRCNFWE